jgi:hypothetical protein
MDGYLCVTLTMPSFMLLVEAWKQVGFIPRDAENPTLEDARSRRAY